MPPGFDGLMMLSRREGVDIRPTLLRVLTDLYVQAPTHTFDEERQYVELASRLIDEVDDATRAVVRARLSIYSLAPNAILQKLLMQPATIQGTQATNTTNQASTEDAPDTRRDVQRDIDEPRSAAVLAMQPTEAMELSNIFFAAGTKERGLILQNLESTSLRAAPRVDQDSAARTVALLEHMALEADIVGFTTQLLHALSLSERTAHQIVQDPGGEALACACKALGMTDQAYQRVLLFLDPELGASVTRVYRLSRFYEALSERIALIMLAAWRGATASTFRGRYRPMLHDDERQRARPTSTQAKSAATSSATPTTGQGTRLIPNG